MQAHKLSSNSWHFWLANWGEDRVYREQHVDICTYIRKVVAGFFYMIAVSSVVAMVGCTLVACFAFLAIWVYDCIVTMTFVSMNPPAFIAAVITVLIAFAFGYSGYEQWQDKRFEANGYQEEPSFVGLVVKKFKSKTCFMIQFEKE